MVMNGGSEDKVSKVSNLWASPSRGLEHHASPLFSACVEEKPRQESNSQLTEYFFKKNEEKRAILMSPT